MVDLSAHAAADNLFIEFYARDDNATSGGQFFVELSNGGTNWTPFFSTDLLQVDTKFLLDLDAEATAAGVALDSDVHVRFRLRTVNSPRAYVDDVRILAGDFIGPSVVEQVPVQIASNTAFFSEIEWLFNEPVETSSVDVGDVQLVAPDGQVIALSDFDVLPGTTNRRFRLSFPAQTLRGTYRVSIGPGIEDVAGNEMNQDGDANNGDGFEGVVTYAPVVWTPPGPGPERYHEGFENWSPVPVTWHFSTQGTGTVEVVTNEAAYVGVGELRLQADPGVGQSQVAGLVVNLSSSAADPNVFLEFYARDDRSGGVGSFVVEISEEGTNWISLLSVDLPETYTRQLVDLDELDPTMIDAETHIRFRQEGLDAPTMYVDELRILTADVVGPRVVDQIPQSLSAVGTTFTNVLVTFDESILPSSLADQVSLVNPQGDPVDVTDVVVVPNTSNRVVEISFAEQVLRGSYRFNLSAGITDLEGNAMNQDGDIVNGDGYTSEILYTAVTWSPSTPGTVLYDEDFEAWSPAPPYWSFFTLGAGRISAGSTENPANGLSHLRILPDSPSLVKQRAEVSVDLSSVAGEDDVFLTFIARDDNPGGGGEFIVEISGDGVSWFEVLNTDLGEVDQSYLIDLDSSAGTAGFAIDSDVYIRLELKTTTVPRVYIDDLRIVTGDFLGARVERHTPTTFANSAEAWSEIDITFNEPVNATMVSSNTVSLIDPQGFAIRPLSVSPVADTTNRVFRVSVPLQTTRGVSRLRVGPGIQDLAGNQMNQDADFLNGELDDFYEADINYEPVTWTPAGTGAVLYEEDFEAWPAIPFHWSFSTRVDSIIDVGTNGLPHGGLQHLVLSPDHPNTQSQWAQVLVDLQEVAGQDDVFLEFWARDDRVGVSGEFLVELSGDGTNWVSLLSTDLPETYNRFLLDLDAAAIAEDIVFDSTVFVRFRLDAMSRPSVFLDDIRFVTGDLTGGRVVNQVPTEVDAVGFPLSQVSLEFSEAMDATSFTAGNAQLIDPQGTLIPILAITPSVGTSSVFQISFPAQNIRGVYRINVGPGVLDVAGNEMNQNADAQNGDGYEGVLSVDSTVWSPAGQVPDIYVENFETWPSIPNYWSFSTAGLGFIRSTATNAPMEGVRHLRFSPPVTASAEQWAQVAIDLSAHSAEDAIFLQFVARDDSAGPAGQFWVELSGDGAGWISLLSLDLPEMPTRYLVDLDVAASAAGIVLDTDVYIRFRQEAFAIPQIFIDDIRVTVGEDLIGPRVTVWNPEQLESTTTSFDQLSVLFDEEIDLLSLTEADVELISPLGIEITPVSIQLVGGSTNRQFRLEFAEQDVRGGYQFKVGPEVRDLVGNEMNQDGDAVNGDGLTSSIEFAPTTWTSPMPEPVLFFEDFDSWAGGIPSHWSFNPGLPGMLVPVSSDGPLSGSVHLAFQPASIPLANLWAQMLIDVSSQAGVSDLYLEFWARDDSTTQGGQFFVEMSDNGQSWTRLLSTDLPETYTRFLLDLDEVGIPLDDQTYIRFRHATTLAPRVFIDDVGIVKGDLLGPVVVDQSLVVIPPFAPSPSELDITFDKPVDPNTVQATDVAIVDPQGLPVSIQSILPVAGSSNRVYRVTFAPSDVRGVFRFHIGPDIQDFSGNGMNENGNAVNGESDDDFAGTWVAEQLTATPPGNEPELYLEDFETWLPASDNWSFKTVGSGSIRAVVTNAPYAGLRHAEVLPPGTPDTESQWLQWAVDLQAYAPANDLFLEFYARDDALGTVGQFFLEISSDEVTWETILSLDLPEVSTRYLVDLDESFNLAGVSIDDRVLFRFRVNASTGPRVYIDHVRVLAGDLLGPVVEAVNPALTQAETSDLDEIQLVFSKPMDPATVGLTDVILRDPQGGSITPLGIEPVIGTTNRVFAIAVPSQNLRGEYLVRVLPGAEDAGGLLLDQDQDGLGGEVGEDEYEVRIRYAPTTWSPPGIGGVVYEEDFESWTSPEFVPNHWSFSASEGGRVVAESGESPFQGSRYLTLRPMDNTSETQWAQVVLDLAPPTDSSGLSLTFVARDDADTFNGQFLLEVSDDGLNWLSLVSTDLPETDTMFQVGLDASGVSFDDDVYVRFRLDAVTAPTVYIDAVALRRGDVEGPRVVELVSDTTVAGSIDQVALEFSEAITGIPSAQAVLISPDGQTNESVNATSVDGLNWVVSFPAQVIPGLYTLLVGPAVFDLVGNPMNQDGDPVVGEDVDDVFYTVIEVVRGQVLPYGETFTNGLPLRIWDTFSSEGGRIEVVNGQVRMDSGNGQFALNEVILYLDLEGASLVTVAFNHENAGDEFNDDGLVIGDRFSESHRNADLVAVSDDGGATWVVLHLLDATGAVLINLDEAFEAYGLQYGSDIRLKISQYDNESWGSDGRGFDALRVEGFAGVNVRYVPEGATIQFSSVRGNTYRIEWRDALLLGSWNLLGNTTGDGELTEVLDASASAGRRYYRVVQFTP